MVVMLSASSITCFALNAAIADLMTPPRLDQTDFTFFAPFSACSWRLLKLSTWRLAAPMSAALRSNGAPGSMVSDRASVVSRERFRRSAALVMVFRRDVMRSWIENCVDTPATSSPSFLALPALRLRRFLLFLFYLKVDGSIDKGPFPPGKGQKRAWKDFQPVESVMGVNRFAVGVRLISAPRD